MGISKEEVYIIVCDLTDEILRDDHFNGLFPCEETAKEAAQDNDWIGNEGKYYSKGSYYLDNNDNVRESSTGKFLFKN